MAKSLNDCTNQTFVLIYHYRIYMNAQWLCKIFKKIPTNKQTNTNTHTHTHADTHTHTHIARRAGCDVTALMKATRMLEQDIVTEVSLNRPSTNAIT